MSFKMFSIYAVKVNPTGTDDDVFLDQIMNQSHNLNQTLSKLRSDGAADATFSSIAKRASEIGFSTAKVATALSKGGVSGFAIASDGTNPGIDFYLQQHQQGGTRKTGSDHIKATLATGILVPQSLQASNDDMATMEFLAVGIYDGTNEPISYTLGEDLPADTIDANQLFYAGPVQLNGTTIEGVQSFNLDFGVNLNRVGGDGVPFDKFVNIAYREPVIRITTHDVENALSVIGENGTGHSEACNYFLRKAADGGARVADATEEHIKLTTNKGTLLVRTINGDSGEPVAAEIEIHPVYDGTNDVIVIDTASAIS